MPTLPQFLKIIGSEFPEDRLTWQKNVPTFHPENAADAAKLLKLANKYARPRPELKDGADGASAAHEASVGASEYLCKIALASAKQFDRFILLAGC